MGDNFNNNREEEEDEDDDGYDGADNEDEEDDGLLASNTQILGSSSRKRFFKNIHELDPSGKGKDNLKSGKFF